MTGLARIHLRTPTDDLNPIVVPVDWVTRDEWGVRIDWGTAAGVTWFPESNVLRVDLEPTID